MSRLLAIDPGKATGWAVLNYDCGEPANLVEAWTTHDGIEGFSDMYWNTRDHANGAELLSDTFDDVVCEGFVLRNNGFVPALNAVEIIGFLKGMGESVNWQLRTDKALVPDRILKEHGLWQTGKMVGHTDGRDCNDAIIHGLAYLFKTRHVPTIAKYFPEAS